MIASGRDRLHLRWRRYSCHLNLRTDTVVVRTTDGMTWSKVFTAENNDATMELVAACGEFASAGVYFGADYERPVVWLSSDGKDRKPVVSR